MLSSDQTNQECKHQWQDVSEVVHHDAVTHEVNHPAEYEQKTVTHTVCNICGSKIDNIIDQHKKETGHYSWTSDVPFQENVMTKGEYTETVVDKEAYDEVVVKNQICNICGETRSKTE